MKQTFVLLYTPGPNWLEGKPTLEQPLKAHLDYMYRLKQDGALIAGGPFLDDSGGLVIIEADNAEEARIIMSGDPAVIGQVFKAEMRPWHQVQLEQYEEIRARLKH